MTYEEAMKLSSELIGRINSLSQEDHRTIEKLYNESLKKKFGNVTARTSIETH